MAFFYSRLKLKMMSFAVDHASNLVESLYNIADVLLYLGHFTQPSLASCHSQKNDMNPEISNSNYIDTDDANYSNINGDQTNDTNGDVAEQQTLIEGNNTEVKLLTPQNLSTDSTESTESYNVQWQMYAEQIGAFLKNLPRYIARFFEENKRPLGVIGLILAALIAVKLTMALLDALNSIFLIAPTLELIGLAYTAWVTYRYLLRASNRQELYQHYQSLKEQVLGTRS